MPSEYHQMENFIKRNTTKLVQEPPPPKKKKRNLIYVKLLAKDDQWLQRQNVFG